MEDSMRTTCRGAAATLTSCVLAATASVTLGVPGIARAATTALVPGSAPPVSASAMVGAAAASQQLTVQVWLKPDLAGAAAFANAVATPGSAEFHRYLSPDAYTARFGPSARQAAAIAAWLTAAGLTRVLVSSGRDFVSATGSVPKVESAFDVRINRYRVTGPDGKPMVIQSNDRDVSVPAPLAPDVLAVTGLDSAPPVPAQTGARSASATCSQYWGQHTQSFRPAYRGLTKGSLPICGYSADQIRAAYGATWASTGKGQTVALIEEQETPVAMSQTLADYAKSNHLPAPKPGQFRETQLGDGCDATAHSPDGGAQPGPPDIEPQIDSEALYAVAPGASQLMVDGDECDGDQALLDAALSVLTGNGSRPSASIESISWVIPIGDMSPQTVHAVDLRAAAEGVGMYFASGDGPGLNLTDSDPYATAVGGTTLGIGAKDQRVFETGWSDDFAQLYDESWSDIGIGDAAGGGTSLDWAQPGYQKGVVPASMSRVQVGKKIVTDRAVPDIAADADTSTAMLIGYIESGSDAHPGPYQTTAGGGTSQATPLIAGLVADAQQGLRTPFGFINPLIYRLAGTRALHDILPVTASMPQQNRDAYSPATSQYSASINVFDSQERAYTSQVTAKGYDTMTGVGTPNGAAFIAGLRQAARCSLGS
jgi:subtilase family serine protease